MHECICKYLRINPPEREVEELHREVYGHYFWCSLNDPKGSLRSDALKLIREGT